MISIWLYVNNNGGPLNLALPGDINSLQSFDNFSILLQREFFIVVCVLNTGFI